MTIDIQTHHRHRLTFQWDFQYQTTIIFPSWGQYVQGCPNMLPEGSHTVVDNAIAIQAGTTGCLRQVQRLFNGGRILA